MRKQWLVGVFVVALAGPTLAQTEVFSAVTVNDQGARYELVIHRTGNRLKIDIDATSAQTSLSGSPRCDSVDLRPDGSFSTYCGGFQAQMGGRVQLWGNLNQRTAQIDTVFRFGSAVFKLEPGPLAKR